MIKASNLCKSFGAVDALKHVSFEIKPGELVGLLGPNGAGKTTTMRLLTGYYKPTKGQIEIDGVALHNNLKQIKKTVGYLPESGAMYHDMLVSDYLSFIAGSFELEPNEITSGIDYAVQATGIGKYFNAPISYLSKGYKQRVCLAATLTHNPSILILDEPTSGLDPNQIIEIQNLIKELAKEKTIILSTHILSEIENIAQRAIIISDGEIVLDSPLEKLNELSRGGYKIHVRIKGSHPESAETLKNIFTEPHETVSLISTSEQETVIILQSPAHHGERVYRAAVEKGWILRELYAEKESLEDVFRDLTRGKK
ncbi:MAG: ATP-binding cassette domain-containing protein [Leptospirales bacterium]